MRSPFPEEDLRTRKGVVEKGFEQEIKNAEAIL